MEEKNLNKSCCEGRSESNNNLEKNNLCPECGKAGNAVKNVTVRHLILNELVEQVGEKDYYLCMNEECEVTYYNNETGAKFNLRQIKVPIWFKKDADPKYACYCSKVTEEQVINAVLKDGATNMKEVLKITGAMSNSQCQKNNPLGKCCHPIIQDAIDKALSLK